MPIETFQMGVSTKGLISLLRSTLTDRYKDYFCIIQELLQNADDAEASTVVYGVRREGLHVDHSLARLPGMFVINDGPVSRENMEAIFSVAAGDKGNEKNKIGKFGLGMKSVFHACEGFFMFGKGHADGLFPQFCTPWLGPYHKAWRDDWLRVREEMSRQVDQIVGSLLPKSKRWFCVWLPLRSEEANDGIYPIIGEYPGDEDINNLICDEYIESAIRFLPMLKHVVDLRFVTADGHESHVVLKPERRMSADKDGQLAGVLSSKTKSGVTYEYLGVERVDGNPTYEHLRNSPRWPKRTEFRDENGETGMVSYSDKTSAHVAVCLLKEPSAESVVTVSPCVFLPLSGVREDAVRFSIPSSGKDSYHLYLHGNFFVDAGRQEFDVGDDRCNNVTYPKDETSLRKVWNRTLFTKSVLPLVIPELEKAAGRWAGDSFDAFMHSLPLIPYLAEWQKDICATDRFIFTYGSGGWSWRKIPRQNAVYSLPEPGNEVFLERLFSCLPVDVHLAKLEKGGLIGHDAIPRKDAEFVSAVFEAAEQMPVDEVLHESMHGFWIAFFDKFPNPRGAFDFWHRVISTSKIRRYADFVSNNIQLINSCRDCFTVFRDCRLIIREIPIWQKIAGAANCRIPLPDVDDSKLSEVPANIVQTSDGEGMLAVIRAMPESDRLAGIAYAMAQLIAKSAGMANLSLECRRFPYWQIENQSYSYEQLLQLSHDGHLYRGKVDSHEKQVFLDAVDWILLRVSPEERREGLVDALGLEVPVLGSDLFISILKRTPALKDVRSRAELVKLLLRENSANGHDWQLAVRYLIHGEKPLHATLQDLYYPAKDLPADFARIALSAIAKAQTGVGYSIPMEIAELLSGPVRGMLMIHEVDNECLVQLLAETPNVQFGGFDDDAWKTLLKLADSVYFNDHTKTLLRKIPLFRTDDGRRVALGTDSFRQGRPEVPHAFRKVVKVIPGCGDAEIDQRLGLVVRQWNYEDALEFSQKLNLTRGSFAEIVRPILHQLPSISDLNRSYVASVNWIKSSRGYVSPTKLLDLPGLRHAAESEELVYPDDVADEELWQDLSKHRLIPSRDVSLKRVFGALANDDSFRIGEVKTLGEIRTSEFLSVFENVEVMPVVRILRECVERGFDCDAALPLLRKELSLDRYVRIANYLTDKVKAGIRYLFPYLQEMSPCLARDAKVISQLRVICRDLSVKSTSCACTYADGVSREYILHSKYVNSAPDFFKLLADNNSANRPRPNKALGSVVDYFKGWDPNFNERICGLVYCCTDDPRDLEYARLHWGLDGRGDPESWRGKVCGELHNMMKGQRLKLWIYDASEVEVLALDGSKLRLGLRRLDENDTLLYGEGNPCRYDPMPGLRNHDHKAPRTLELKLRRLRPEELSRSADVLNSVLRNTLSQIVKRLCDQWMIDVNGVWAELSNVEQVDIAVTRSKLLEKADIYLPMLRCDDAALRQHIEVWDELGYAIQDVRNRKGCEARYHELQGQKDAQLEKFAAAIENSSEVQGNILSAIREQMESYAYHRESILFELFQNADDAAEELRALYPDKHIGFKDSFVVDYDGNSLVVVHWGRQINQNKGIDVDAAPRPSFARDLEKMLMLMQSAKAGEGLNVTGKFGLGFKTVFFFTDEPIVMSGRLKFKIVGGFLPKALDDTELMNLNGVWSKYANGCGALKPTIFVLPVRSDCKDRVDDAMKAFSEHARMSALFSRRIKKIDMTFSDGRHEEFDGANVEASGNVLVFNASHGSQDHAAVVTGIQDGSPCSLPTALPTYWVTVPTRQRIGGGFIINGRFELDTGRSNLNRAARKNSEAVACIGKGLETSLIKDFEARKGRDSNVGFYESLWIVLSSCKDRKVWDHDSAALARGILWDEKTGGARRFYSSYSVLPTGLFGAYRVLTEARKVSHVLTVELVDSPMSEILGVAGLIPGTVISGKLYPRDIRQFVDGLNVKEFGMQEFFAEAMKTIGCFSPDLANSTPGLKICEWFTSEGKRPDAAQSFVDQVRFLSDDGKTWKSACDLVVDDGGESLKAAFCPKDAVLSHKYDANGIKLFRKIRGSRSISAEQLARYAECANDEKGIICILRYLRNRKDEEMADFLCHELQPKWLETIPHLKWYKELDVKGKQLLASLLDLGVGAVTGWEPLEDEFGIPTPISKVLTLQEVRNWWRNNEKACIAHYNMEYYGRDDVTILPKSLETIESRIQWLELLVMSSACTLGMRGRQHKGFVDMLKRKGYFAVYANARSTPDDWMQTLEDFIEQPAFAQEYQYWMRLFIRIFQFGRHLDDYVKYIMMWDDADAQQVLRLRSVRTNGALSGTGINVPDLEKAINDSGMHFLVRELIRRKALSNKNLHCYCHMPRSFAEETFGGAFDIAIHGFLKAKENGAVNYVFV